MATFTKSLLIIRKCSVQWSHYIPKLFKHIKFFKRVCRSYLNEWQGQKNVYWSTEKSISVMMVWRWQLSKFMYTSKLSQHLHQYKLYKFSSFSSMLLKFPKMLASLILSTRCTTLSLYLVKVASNFCITNSNLAMNQADTWLVTLVICSHHLVSNMSHH
jgi:hypothetical protein